MRIVVDTNIVFSAILNSNSKIARILLQPKNRLNFYSTDQLLIEVLKHRNKLKSISKYSDQDLDKIIQLIIKKIRFINVKLISKESYKYALDLSYDIDIDDTEFIALAEHIKGKFWTGDKALQKGLIKKGWNKLISTQELLTKNKTR